MKIFNKIMVVLTVVVISGVLYAQVPAPTDLTATQTITGQSAQVKLAWTAPTGVTGLKYYIYRKDKPMNDSGLYLRLSSNVRTVSFTDYNVGRGKTYTYYVTAYKNNQTSEPSNKAEIAISPLVYSYITGTITKEDGITPLYHANVQIIPVTDPVAPIESPCVITDSLGHFTARVFPGTYALYFAAQNMVSEFYDNKASLETADHIVLAGNDTVTANASLAAIQPPTPPTDLTAILSYRGQMPTVKLTWTAATETGLRYAVYRKEGDTSSFRKITSGLNYAEYTDYNVRTDKSYSYYVVAYRNDFVSLPSNTVTIVVGPPVYGVIYGTITADSTSAPVYKAAVQVISVSSQPMPADCKVYFTDSLGNYRIKVTPGQYALYFSAPGMISEYYDNKTSFQNADHIVIAGSDSVAANAALGQYVPPPTYYLSGVVTDANNAPVRANVTMFRLRSNTYHYYCSTVRTDSLGNYKIKVKPNDTVIVYAQAFSRNYLTEYYNNKRTFAEADRIAIAGNTADINFVMDLKPVYPNGIAGVVKDSAGVGVPGHIAAYKIKANGQVEKSYSVLSDSLGVYAFANLLPGKYILRVIPMNNYRPTYFKYDGSQASNWRNADSVMVDSAAVVGNINFLVVPRTGIGFGHIVGRITDLDRRSVNSAFVYAIDQNSTIAAYAITDRYGNYEISDIAAGSYRIVIEAFGYKASSSDDISVDYLRTPVISYSTSLTSETATPTSVNETGVVNGFTLDQNYPNPFNPSTVIRYSTVSQGHVKLAVYDFLGREVAVLVNQEQAANSYTVEFNASKLSSGVYFYKLETGHGTLARKLTLMK